MNNCGGGYFLAQHFAKRNVDDSYQNLDIIEGADAPTDTSKTWGDSGTGYITSWAGSGSKEDPYLITCAEELAGLSYMAQTNEYYGICFKQTRDIDLKKYYWRPIGKNYCGLWYDGGGHKISGLFTATSCAKAGLFADIFYQSEGQFKNIGIEDSYIQGSNVAGAIVANSSMGGLSLENCYNASPVRLLGSGSVGGLVGSSVGNASFKNCYNSGSVTGAGSNNNIGGLIGNTFNAPTFINCYNVGTMTGSGYLGGFLGYSGPNGNLIMRGSFNIGSFSTASSSSKIAAFIASVTPTTTELANIYHNSHNYPAFLDYLDNSSFSASLDDNVKNQAFLEGEAIFGANKFDFKNIWHIQSDINDGYPIFKWQATEWTAFADTNWVGSGTETSPYLINTPEKLVGVAKLTNAANDFSGKYFKQTKNINLGGYEWIPIGDTNHYFIKFILLATSQALELLKI